MTPFEIKCHLLEQGVSMRSIARDTNLSVSFVSKVINRERKSVQVASAVSIAIGKPLFKCFPDYVDVNRQNEAFET